MRCTLHLHMWYSTLAFCICDYITNWSIASYQEIFLPIPVEDKLATHEIAYISLHKTHIWLYHSAQQNKAVYQQYKRSLLLPPRRKISTMKKHELSSIVMSAAHTDKLILIFCEYKNHSKENNNTIICDQCCHSLRKSTRFHDKKNTRFTKKH